DYIADPFRYAADALLRISPENLTVTLSDAEEILPDCESIRVGDLVEVTPEEQLVPSPDQVAALVARFCS
ncbi:MAG: hypothetical protein K2G01_06275, partial [Paramuribaculum sp.]|nr:hypothetical protein [Paramuribaculum sp.]